MSFSEYLLSFSNEPGFQFECDILEIVETTIMNMCSFLVSKCISYAVGWLLENAADIHAS